MYACHLGESVEVITSNDTCVGSQNLKPLTTAGRTEINTPVIPKTMLRVLHRTHKLAWTPFSLRPALAAVGSGQGHLIRRFAALNQNRDDTTQPPAQPLAASGGEPELSQTQGMTAPHDPPSSTSQPPIGPAKKPEAARVPRKVAILWDLDNKQPQGPVVEAVRQLRRLAKDHGEVVEFTATANRHAFDHIPDHVSMERAERKALDRLESSGLAVPESPYVCPICGAKCETNALLKTHFKGLHKRELKKKLKRLGDLRRKGAKRAKKFLRRNSMDIAKRIAAEAEVLGHRRGYGLKPQLEQLGVSVRMVSDKPQSADHALHKLWADVSIKGLSALVLVSDDSDFLPMISGAAKRGVYTIVVGENPDGKLARQATKWVSWHADLA